MPFDVFAIKYSLERVFPIVKMLCVALDEMPGQKAVTCTCCSAVIKHCEITPAGS